jgi:hypothetical protein
VEAAKHTVRGRSLRTYRRARTTLCAVVVFWLWLLLGAAAFVAGLFDSPAKVFLAMYAGAVAVLVSIPVALLAAILMVLNRAEAGGRRPATERLSAAARAAGPAISALPWAEAAGRARELGGKVAPASRRIGAAARSGAGQLRAGQWRGVTGRRPGTPQVPRPAPTPPQPAERPVAGLPGAGKPVVPRRPPVPPRPPAVPPVVDPSGQGLEDVAS